MGILRDKNGWPLNVMSKNIPACGSTLECLFHASFVISEVYACLHTTLLEGKGAFENHTFLVVITKRKFEGVKDVYF